MKPTLSDAALRISLRACMISSSSSAADVLVDFFFSVFSRIVSFHLELLTSMLEQSLSASIASWSQSFL